MTADSQSSPTSRVLVLADANDWVARALEFLKNPADARIVHSLEDLVRVLPDTHPEIVVTSAPGLLPLVGAVSREHRFRVLERIGHPMCIIGDPQQPLWANAALREYPPTVRDTVHRACTELRADLLAERAAGRETRVRQRALVIDHEYFFDLSVAVLPEPDGQMREVLGLLSDTTEISRMREKLDAIDTVGRELVALDMDAADQLDVSERLQVLEQKLIKHCHELLDFTHFAVMVLDPQTNHLDTVLAGGFSEEAKDIDIYATKEGNGISGYVAATGQSYICPDITHDPLYLPGYECASSCLTVPLYLVDRVVGVLNVESDEPDKFTDEDRQVAEIFGRYIAVALHTLRLLAVERTETAGQVTADVSAETTAPLDRIIAEASRLMESPPTDPAEAREALARIIDRVDDVKETLQQAGKLPAIRGLLPESTDADPALKGKRVLVADDEDIIRETIGDVLSKTGALAVTARDGDEAITMIRSQRFDLVLSDIKMPHRNGYEVFAAVSEVQSNCPVILITGFGYDPDHSIVRASREGLAAVLFKPFKVEQLLEAIHKALVPAG